MLAARTRQPLGRIQALRKRISGAKQVSTLAGGVSQPPRRRCMATSEPSASPKQSKKCNPALRIFQPLEACTRSRWVSLEKE
jgi:hypothetical protein